jgi:hypothetical protein
MEPTSDTETSPKRRRFSKDNPFCASSDSDMSYDEDPAPKAIAHSKTNGTNTTNNTNKGDNSTHNKSDTTSTHPPSGSSNPLDEITFNSAFDDFNVNSNEQRKLVEDFKKIMTKFNCDDSEIKGVEEIKKTLDDLRPMNDVVYLYVRFARQQPTWNFNMDSLCSLLCLAKQCDYKPYLFLTKVKSLEIRNNRCKYGVSFSFVTRNSKDVDGVFLEKRFLGLKYTLDLLQETFSKTESILEKANHQMTKSTIPPTKRSSLYSKLWLGIRHRWLAYHMVDHLFSMNTVSTLTNQAIFVLSIQLFAPCGRSRYDFLNPLVGVCLRFENHGEINHNRDELAPLQADPNSFHTYGNRCLRDKTLASRVQSIYQTFSNLKKIHSKKVVKRQISYRTMPLESKWLLLKAYTYHLWLEQSQNSTIKSSVVKMLSQENSPESSGKVNEASTTTSGKVHPGNSSKSRKDPPNYSMVPTMGTAQSTKPNITSTGLKRPSPKPANTDSTGGLEELLATRKNSPPLWHPVNNNPDAPPNSSTSCLPDIIAHPNCDWNKLRLLSTRLLVCLARG